MKKFQLLISPSLLILFISYIFFTITSVLYSQTAWTVHYGRTLTNDEAYSVMQTLDGNFLVIGDTGNWSGSLIVKYNNTGSLLWSYPVSQVYNIGNNAAEDINGNLYFSFDNGILKTNSAGNILWMKFLSDTSLTRYIKLSSDKTRLFKYGTDRLILSDTSGNVVWSVGMNDSQLTSYNIYDIAETGGYIYIAGIRAEPGIYRGFIRKYDFNGNLIFTHVTPVNGRFNAINETSDNTLLAAGRLNFSLYCVKINSDGNLLWTRNYVFDSLANCYSIAKAGSDKFVLATGGYDSKSKCVVIDSDGNVVINKDHYYGLMDNVLYQNVITASDSGFVFTGYIETNDNGTIDWIVVKTDKYGNTTPIGINMISSNIPADFKLHQNYPNPFNPTTNIKIELPASGNKLNKFTFRVYNLTGELIKDEYFEKPGGVYELFFDAGNLTSGVYFYSVNVNGKIASKKMILLK